MGFSFLKSECTGDFPGGPVAKTRRSPCRGPRCDPWSGNEIPHTTTEDPTCCNEGLVQPNKKKKNAYSRQALPTSIDQERRYVPRSKAVSSLRRHLQSLWDLYSNGSLPTAAKVGDGKFGICSHVRLLDTQVKRSNLSRKGRLQLKLSEHQQNLK